jgi:hypothetical protein
VDAIAGLMTLVKKKIALFGGNLNSVIQSLTNLQTDFAVHPASCKMGVEGAFPRMKRAGGRETNHSSRAITEAGIPGVITPLPHSPLLCGS